MSVELINLENIDLINPSSIDPNARLYLKQNGKSYSIYWRNIENILKNGFNNGLVSSEGDGFIFENNAVNSRKLNYSDLRGIPLPSPFNRNISVTYTQVNDVITINPLGDTQEYEISSITYSITDTYSYVVSDLINNSNQRIDLIILKKNGVIEYRKGEESTVGVSPIINGDEFVYLQILKTSASETVGSPSSTVSAENGLSVENGNVIFGGILSKDTTLDVSTRNLTLGSIVLTSSALTVNGLIRDNDNNLPNLDNQALVFDSSTSKLIWKKVGGSEQLPPTITSGSILFGGLTNNITEDNANLFWDNTNKDLNIRGKKTQYVSTQPTVVVDASTEYVEDFNGPGTASPVWITEDGKRVSLREAEIKSFEVKFGANLETTYTIEDLIGNSYEFLSLDFGVRITSVSIDVRDITAGNDNTPWTSVADIAALNVFISGLGVASNWDIRLTSVINTPDFDTGRCSLKYRIK